MKRNVLSRRNISSSARLNFARTAALLTAALAALPAFAVDDNFTGPSGDSWNTAADWTTTSSTHVVPGNGDDATYSSVAVLNFNGNYSGVGLDSLDIDSIGHASSNFRQTTASTLIATYEDVGTTANTSIYTQTAGTNIVTDTLFLATGIDTTGNYALSGSGILTVGATAAQFTANEYIGTYGQATFTQSGGTHTLGSPSALQALNIGFQTTASGNYILNAASALLTVNGNEDVGAFATGILSGTTITQYGGTFTQSAGNHTVTGSLTVGDYVTATGSYTLTGGNLSAGSSSPAFTVAENIGENGVGTFTQSGGNHTIGSAGAPQTFFIGALATGIGCYTMSNAASTLFVNGNEFVGGAATGNATQAGGTFTQNNGNHTVSQSLSIARVVGSTGTFTLTGGNLTTATVTTFTSDNIGEAGNATFTQTGGNFTVGTPATEQRLQIGDSSSATGAYSFSGSSNLTVDGDEFIGVSAPGTTTSGVITQYGGSFLQTSGNHTITDTLTIAANPGSTGSYALNGGNLSVGFDEILGKDGIAVFSQNGGSNTIGTPSSPAIFEFAVDADSTATYTINTPVSSLVVYGSCLVGELGTGTLNITAGDVSISSQLIIDSPTSVINFSGGLLTVGAILTNGQPANFHWTGGTLQFTENFTLDLNSPFGATLNILPGMQLSLLGTDTFTNNGSLTLSGGSLNAGSFINNTLLAGFGTIVTSGPFTNIGAITQSGGNLIFSLPGPNFINQGIITLAPGFQMQMSGITITNNNTINLNNGTLTSLTQVNNSASGLIMGPGTITSVFTNAGTLFLPSGITKVGTFTNTGIIEMAASSAQLGPGGAITNSSVIEGFGKISDDITNSSSIEPLGGTLILAGSLTTTASSLLTTSTGTKLLITGAAPSNQYNGLISLVGGTLDTNNQPLILTAGSQITGYGTLRTGGLTNNGAITFTGGTSTVNGPVTNSANKTIVAKNDPAIFTGNVTNNGTIVATNTTITFTGTYTGNAYISDPSTNIFQNNVTIISGGSMSGGPSDAFIFAGPSVSNSGNFTSAGSLTASTAFTNSANFTQSGLQSWSPGSSFTNTAGHASFQSNAKLYGLTITGGTVDLTSSKLIIENTSAHAATLASLKGYAASGALTSSIIPANKTFVISDNAIAGLTSFGGFPVDSGSILETVAYKGDYNLDGVVDIKDLQIVANHWQQPATDWSQGDFDGNGIINIVDLQALANNWQAGVGSGGGGSGDISFNEALALVGGFGAPSTVPEPTSLALLTLGGLALATHRRQNC